MKKIFIKIINFYYKFKLNSDDKKILKKHPEFKNLNKDEKRIINNKNKKICKIYKNIFPGWDNCDKAYFVSDYLYQTKILPVLNGFNYDKFGVKNKKSYFLDKNYQSLFIENSPNEILRCIDGEFRDNKFNFVSQIDSLNILNNFEKVVFKCSIGTAHGKGILVVEKKDYENALKTFGKNFVVQSIIQQHDLLSQYNKSSVNVIRITSLLWKNEVYIIGAILRVGAPGAFCDHLGKNGYNPRIASIDSDGTLGKIILDPDDVVIYDNFFGVKPNGKIPKFNEMKEYVKKQHIKYPHHKLIGWDLTVNNEEKIICIEFNSLVPGVIQTQMVCGPIFVTKTSRGNKLLDEILDEEKE